MSTKIEEKIKKLIDDNLTNNINIMNERMSGVFFYGVIVGIILSYSNLLGYLAGISTGIIMVSKYKFISYQITDKSSIVFQKIIETLK